MAACSSSHSTPGRCEPLSCSSLHVPPHDIFLSHSGAQKPFVKALYQRLHMRYSTFFDITHHSLPLGELFPSHIFSAARTCRLAVVVLSQEYVQSKWPMLELCAFFAATPPPKILPLFLKLTVYDLKEKENLDKWHFAWQKFAEEDPRIDVSAWKSAFKKVSSYNGVTLNQHEDESAYIERVFSGICENLPPSIRYDFSGIQGIHRLSEIVLAKFKGLDDDQSNVCVLGMYGLPGSGKSTICRYLCENLFFKFAGKAIHLELPTGAKNEELLIKSKELLKQLTNFNNKMDLSCVSDFREVYRLLKGTDLLSAKVFLVVDNISSHESGNVAKALLRLGLTVGSKVLLVARSIKVLRPLLQEDGSHQSSHYVYGSMSVPSLNKEEALRILLQSGDGVGLADSYAPEAALTPRHREIMEEAVNMFGFSEEHGCTSYLPLVMKIVGEQLREHELNVEKWNRAMKSFQIKIGLCKEEALKQMVLKSFETLPGSRLRTLFLDLALFIVPLSYLDGESHKLDEACSHLSLIHSCKSEEIEFEMEKLQQHGFLTIYWKGRSRTPTVSVHDFYLEFATSIEEASKYYWSSGFRWSKIQRNQAIEAVGTRQLELRTVVLEQNEECERFEFSSDFLSVRAMVLRNCKSLKILQGFANLRSLMSLEIHNCPRLKWVEPPAAGQKQPCVQRFKWVNQEFLQQEELETSSAIKAIGRLFWENLLQVGLKIPRMTVDGLFLQMKGLQVLTLENTGIRQYVDMSGCLPQLRVLEVSERHMKGLRVCNLPNLESCAFFGDANPLHPRNLRWTTIVSPSSYDRQVCDSLVPRRGSMLGKEFLAGCPKVREVFVQCVGFEDEGSRITFTSSPSQVLISGQLPKNADRGWSISRVEGLKLSQCPELISLNFGSSFRNFQEIRLDSCHNLTEVSGFRTGLPMLQTLKIVSCSSLKIVSFLGDLVSLREIEVRECPSLQRCLLPDLENLTELEDVHYDGPHNVNETWDVRKLVKLTCLYVNYNSDRLIGLESLESLAKLGLYSLTPDVGHTTLVDLATLLGIMAPCCFSLKTLHFSDLGILRSLNGIEFLGSLKALSLQNLQNLSCLRGIECLGRLKRLIVEGCASLEEMPSLLTLVKLRHLYFSNCKKLRSLEGCGELEQLEAVYFTSCKSLAQFPLDLRSWKSSVRCLRIEGSKFASGEAVMAWAENEELPVPLRHASLSALHYELQDNSSRERMIEMLVDKLVQKALNRLFDDNDEGQGNDGNHNEEVFVAHVSRLAKDCDLPDLKEWVMFGRLTSAQLEVLEEGLRCLNNPILHKQCLIDLCQSNVVSLHFLFWLFVHSCNILKLERTAYQHL